MFSTEILILLTTIFAYAVYFYYMRVYRLKKFLQNFPCPTNSILGSAVDFKTPAVFLKKLHEYTNEHGSMVHMQIGPIGHGLICSDVKFLEFLLTHGKLLKKSFNLQFLEPWVGKGLITADGGPRWKLHRKLITPAFHFKILEQFVDIFEADGDTLVEKLSPETGKTCVDIYPYVTKCALEAICESAMGTKVDVQNDKATSYFESVKTMCRIFIVRSTSGLLPYNWIFRLTKDYALQTKSLKILHDYTNGVIKAKRKMLRQRNIDVNDKVDDIGMKKRKAFLDLILEAQADKQSLTDEEIREEVDTIMFAGHDTTATSATFTLYCIANNKEVQEKVIEEQQQIFGDNKNPTVTYANLQEMKYLENVIKESMRIYSPVPIYGRLIDQDVEYNGMIVPQNLQVLIFANGLHMNPKYYPNPEKFDPSRFDAVGDRHPFAFIPFSAGPRNCIGQKFAMLELKSIVSKVVRNFELTPASPQHQMELSPETVLKSLNGVKIGLKLR